ncbi:hypothetical protein HRbin22_01001 [Candidatus Thermoflexus japonica]|uniref:Uncharacterized protein n=1 Tax=Candidatus Thermoflexus japonica TaxID=2035417 RepID=A0A2H5Y5N9_9CHLR|nr:hypothetical protein HRbin22_01001 [Candidatus Thermoflexus japonica]
MALRRLLRLPSELPVLVGFEEEILPVLTGFWLALLIGFILGGWDWAFAVGVWGTVTLIMLWPVGRRLGRRYLSYRTPWFILGVLSMAYIPLAGFVLQSDLPFSVKSAVWFGLPIDLTVFAIIPSLRAAIAKPIRMFFRPDLLFGDGRLLCCGIIAIVLGMRYIIGSPPMGVPWPIPKWNWWAILFAMLAGFIPMIPIRGMLKLVMRLGRLTGRWGQGWGSILLRESALVLSALGIGYGFHNAFLGTVPFTVPISTDHPHFRPALLILLAGAAWIIFVRGAYKKYGIGDPFIREQPGQTAVKQILLVIGLVPMFYGLMSILHLDPMHLQRGVGGLRHPGNWAGLWGIGGPFILWGLIVLIPFRVLGQINQRMALVQQMAAIVLPAMEVEDRRRILVRIMSALAEMPEASRRDLMRAMLEALREQPEPVRVTMAVARMEAMAVLPEPQRITLMRTMDALMAGE